MLTRNVTVLCHVTRFDVKQPGIEEQAGCLKPPIATYISRLFCKTHSKLTWYLAIFVSSCRHCHHSLRANYGMFILTNLLRQQKRWTSSPTIPTPVPSKLGVHDGDHLGCLEAHIGAPASIQQIFKPLGKQTFELSTCDFTDNFGALSTSLRSAVGDEELLSVVTRPLATENTLPAACHPLVMKETYLLAIDNTLPVVSRPLAKKTSPAGW